MEGVILILVALGALIAFGAGIVLLVLYFRSGREERQELVRYGNLVQCPRCGYMNPADSAACLNCRLPFTHARPPAPPAPPAIAQHPTIPPTAYQPVRPTPPPPSYTPPPASGATVPREVKPTPREAQQTVPAQASPAAPPTPTPSPAESGHAWLEGKTGALADQRIILAQADTMVGRSTSCDVQIYDPKVSRKHFLIRYGNGAYFLQDQESSRGTYINGERVIAQRLNNGDRIDLGDTSLVFHLE